MVGILEKEYVKIKSDNLHLKGLKCKVKNEKIAEGHASVLCFTRPSARKR